MCNLLEERTGPPHFKALILWLAVTRQLKPSSWLGVTSFYYRVIHAVSRPFILFSPLPFTRVSSHTTSSQKLAFSLQIQPASGGGVSGH